MTKLSRRILLAGGPTKARSILLGLIFLASTAVAISYHLIAFSSGSVPALPVQFGYEAVVIVGYIAVWLLLSDLFEKRRPTPARTFWSLTLFAGGVFIVSAAVLLIARPSEQFAVPGSVLVTGFDLETGIPIVLAAVFQMNVLALLAGLFAIVLMLRLRDLVLVKRSRSSERNWRLMVALMVIASLSVIATPFGADLQELQIIAIIAAVVLMVVNSFRLSWIVFLSFRDKMIAVGLCVMLLVTLVAALGIIEDSDALGWMVPGRYAYVGLFSYPVSMFSSLAVTFGVLYSTTTVLSLLFHLPTTGEFQARTSERSAMSSLTSIVNQVFDADKLYDAIAASPVEAGAAQLSWLAVLDPDSTSLSPQIASAHGITTARVHELIDLDAFYQEVQTLKQPMILEHALGDRRVRARTGDGIGSLIIAPLRGSNRMVGALFACKDVVRGFERDEVDTISILAGQASVAIENAQLLEERVERERLSRELAIAREVQQRLLPQSVPSLPGLSIAASSVSAQEVGGDYYDFVELSDNRLGVIIADVSGKGTSAAFYMAEMQGIFQSVSRLAPSPAEFLHHANVAISSSLERNVFVSVIYGVVDSEREEFVLARAGHCPAAYVGVTGAAQYVRTAGIGLGLDRGKLFRSSLAEAHHKLRPGDVFALYTDGVVESRNAAGDEYGYDRLLDLLQNIRHEEAEDVHGAVISDLNEFVEDGDYGDDMTLVILKWHGLPSPQSIADMAQSVQHA